MAHKERNALWVSNYTDLEIHNSRDGHWGRGQTGFNVAPSGRVFLSDGRKVKVDGEWVFPCHRNLIAGRGQDRTGYSGIYSYGYRDGPTLWLYPDLENAMTDAMRKGLASLIGVHRIDAITPVRSNTSRRTLFRLGDVDPQTGILVPVGRRSIVAREALRATT